MIGCEQAAPIAQHPRQSAGPVTPGDGAIPSGPLTENSAHSYLLRLVARMLATGWVPQFEERECGDGVQVWTVTWRRKGE